jgi:hypothetical protein
MTIQKSSLRASSAVVAKIATEKVQISTLAIVFSIYTQHILYSTIYFILNIIFNYFLLFFFLSLSLPTSFQPPLLHLDDPSTTLLLNQRNSSNFTHMYSLHAITTCSDILIGSLWLAFLLKAPHSSLFKTSLPSLLQPLRSCNRRLRGYSLNSPSREESVVEAQGIVVPTMKSADSSKPEIMPRSKL